MEQNVEGTPRATGNLDELSLSLQLEVLEDKLEEATKENARLKALNEQLIRKLHRLQEKHLNLQSGHSWSQDKTGWGS